MSPTSVVASPSASPSAASPSEDTAAGSVGTGLTLGPVGLAGVNDPTCKSERPPVLLLHGTFSSIAVDFPILVPALLDAGFCVYGADYGRFGTQAITGSAAEFARVVTAVRDLTGAPTVDVVGFSQGGLVLRTALRQDDLAAVVTVAVLISPSFHGTTSPLIDLLPGGFCPACSDQVAGSALLAGLAAGGDLDGEVRYAVVVTSSDEIVTPWESQFPVGPSDRVRSVVLDDRCPGIAVRHQDMAHHPAVVGWSVAALTGDGAVTERDLHCS